MGIRLLYRIILGVIRFREYNVSVVFYVEIKDVWVFRGSVDCNVWSKLFFLS